MLRRLWAAAACAGCLLLPAGPALASGQEVITDCMRNGRLTKSYTQKEYASALANMPTDVQEYSDCEAIIRRARTGLGDSTGTGTGKDPFNGSAPQEAAQAQKDITSATRSGGGGAQRFRVGNRDVVVRPGALAHREVSAGISNIPGSLLVLVILLVLGGAYGALQLWTNRDRSSDTGS